MIKPKILPHHLIVFVFIILAYFASRSLHLTAIPVFGDEAIYLRWSQIIKNVETLRFIPLTDGKQPLFMWLTVPFFKLFSDPLFAGRFLSIFAGFGTMAGLGFTAYLLTSSLRTFFLTIVLYLILPFTFFFDRLALPDNLLSFFGIWSLALSLLLARFPRLDLAMILGFTLGGAWLTKSPAVYFIVLAPVTFLLSSSRRKQVYFPLISVIIAFFIYNLLRLGPQFHQIALRNLDYIWPISEIIRHPLSPLLPHLKDIFNIYWFFIGYPAILLPLVLVKSLTKKETRLLLLWWLLPLLANAAFAKVFTARYILFTFPPLILLLSVFLSQINKKITFIYLFFIPCLLTLYRLAYRPFNLRLPSTETGYLRDWTAGWGIKESAGFLKERAKAANVIVGTEGYFGTLPDGLQIYTNQVPNLTVFGVGVDIHEIPDKLIDAQNYGDEVYLLFNRSRLKLPPDSFNRLRVISSFSKPDGDSLLLLRL